VSLSRKLLMSSSAIALAVGVMATLGAGSAFAGSPPVAGTGTVSCTSAAGSLKFSPPLNFTGGSAETVKVKVTLGGCSNSGGNVTTPSFSGKASGTIDTSSNDCTNLEGTQPVSGSLDIKWNGKVAKAKLDPSTLTLSSITGVASGANGDAGFTFSNQPLTGSFPAAYSGEIDSNESASTLAGSTGCGAKHGLKKLTIVAGSLSPSPVGAS
jgi:hypothetical protein